MKTLAEQLREFMDQVAEAPVGKRYDIEWTVPGFPMPEGMDPDDWEEEFDVGINYTVSGKYRPARITANPENDHPEEFPEVELDGVYRLDTGEDITEKLTPEQRETVMNKVHDHSAERSNDDDGDADRWYDEMKDRRAMGYDD